MNFAAITMRMSAGIAVWALHFLAVYGATALACARDSPHLAGPAVALATLVAVVLLAVVLVRGCRRRSEFEWWFGAAAAAFALVAVLFEALPALIVQPCA